MKLINDDGRLDFCLVRHVAAIENLASHAFMEEPDHRQIVGGHPMRKKTVQRASLFLLTMSTALVTSMKTKYNGMFCSIHFSLSCLKAKIMTIGLLLGLKPHFASWRFASETVRWVWPWQIYFQWWRWAKFMYSFRSQLRCLCSCRGKLSGHHGSHPPSSLSRNFAGRH